MRVTTFRCNNSIKSGQGLVVHGNNNTVRGAKCQVFGNDNRVTGDGARVYGNGNHVKGTDIYARGDKNTLEGVDVVAEGNHNVLKGVNVKIQGQGVGNKVLDGRVREEENEQRRQDQQAMLNNLILFSILASTSEVQESERDRKKARRQDDDGLVQGPSAEECKHDTEELEENEQPCVCCLTNKPICATIPCLHQCVCVECARRLCFHEECDQMRPIGQVKCPQCREPVDGIKRVFKG